MENALKDNNKWREKYPWHRSTHWTRATYIKLALFSILRCLYLLFYADDYTMYVAKNDDFCHKRVSDYYSCGTCFWWLLWRISVNCWPPMVNTFYMYNVCIHSSSLSVQTPEVLFIYSPFHKTLPRSSAFVNLILVRYYETET